ncbi:hypothetical protein G6F57_007402 [Rhizopus arrhizus]|uniref:Ribosomal protein S15 n=1 Tax=Rhizopus oryzae TaxID=64495 RepID=A0A9P6X7Q0_RHIOR|nr:hypothetical protein G6F23_010956 [Rhizopus arrhizus]KAG1417402.1 hypothetical protein G6F58_005539 [Rhizopus delemar]KAG0762064.1 hypothetical protein G6F24_007084 [Rhizopus arrhizus]KAG0782089.1 hypothetical protein G6F22_009268 [Rhizopus arrhizus]KAG0788536.1 hypothetical protein G6F21_007145 [Rhizopus arrhizus]
MFSRLSSYRSASSHVLKQGFHTSAISFAKKHPKQVKKENLAKRAAKLAELERTKPSFIVSQPTKFFETLLTPAEAYGQNKQGFMHFLDEKDQTFLFNEIPERSVDVVSAIDGKESALKQEQSKVETIQKLLSLQNGNAKAVQIWNIHKAIDWFKRKEGDTGSPEVQAAVLTVRIHNLNNHLNQHRKDKHNYKQLRTMVHDRAKLLKYLKSKSPERYYSCLEQLGLQPRAVEGEITV